MKKMKILSVLLFLALVIPGAFGAQDAGVSSAVLREVKTYEELRHAISQTRAASRVRVEKAVEKERVREAWEIGRLIDAHVLQHKERADYGAKVLERLATDLGMSRTELSYMLQFARAYPIFRTSEELSWAHYESLLALNDAREREEVGALASKEKWPVKKLRDEVKKRKAAAKGTGSPAESGVPVLLKAQPGKPGTYEMVKATVGPETGKIVIDLGFSNYYKTSKDLRFTAGAIIEASPAASGKGSSPSDLIRLSKRTPEDLYTYRAWVVNVLDGDTLKVVVDLGFGVRSVQTLRLRGIDCPEIVSKEGKEAKEFVEKTLQIPWNGERGTQAKAGAPILIKTVKSDKYDRYLADVYLLDAKGQEVYLNNLLLEQGHAVRVRE
ncbi:MAG: hypothetical protein A2351_01320 [Omnitrophica bacterium RIFOXYB12_FULL_50_7]|nr:MAG: hypothetical protein A2351_01320 [Omnitrophica bacterium RIFOXYB12_FULL_50_7]